MADRDSLILEGITATEAARRVRGLAVQLHEFRARKCAGVFDEILDMLVRYHHKIDMFEISMSNISGAGLRNLVTLVRRATTVVLTDVENSSMYLYWVPSVKSFKIVSGAGFDVCTYVQNENGTSLVVSLAVVEFELVPRIMQHFHVEKCQLNDTTETELIPPPGLEIKFDKKTGQFKLRQARYPMIHVGTSVIRGVVLTAPTHIALSEADAVSLLKGQEHFIYALTLLDGVTVPDAFLRKCRLMRPVRRLSRK